MGLYRQRLVILGLMVLGMIGMVHAPLCASFVPLPLSKDLIQRQSKRVENSRIDKLVATLGIKKGMTILDIGTGSGQYAYKFAKILKGTGKIFATDVNPDMVQYVQEQSNKNGLKNIEAVLVNAQGVDDFYAQNKYDLIFMAHTDGYIDDLKGYIRTMKGYLKPGGRFVLLRKKDWTPFELEDFTDFKGLLGEILNESAQSLFDRYLISSKAQIRAALSSEKIPQQLKDQVVSNFNSMLRDLFFYRHFLKEGSGFKENLSLMPDEKYRLGMQLGLLNEAQILNNKGILDISKKNNTHYHFSYTTIPLMNQTLIIQRFRKFLYNGKSIYLPGGKKTASVRNLENLFIEAGYNLDGEYDFIPYDILMIFST